MLFILHGFVHVSKVGFVLKVYTFFARHQSDTWTLATWRHVIKFDSVGDGVQG